MEGLGQTWDKLQLCNDVINHDKWGQ